MLDVGLILVQTPECQLDHPANTISKGSKFFCKCVCGYKQEQDCLQKPRLQEML